MLLGLGVAAAGATVLIGIALSGTGSGGSATPTTIIGPVWQWEQLASGDGSVTAVADPSAYTIEFRDDGSIAVRADCNTGFGTYAESGGGLEITVTGMTRAACPQGSLGDRYVRDLGLVRTYVLEDGALHLNLLADAGNLVHGSA
jgi:heat shock protein HslJ